jgi:hypothetical protein
MRGVQWNIFRPGCETARAKHLLGTIQRLASLGITGAMRTTPTNAKEALLGPPAMDLVVHGEARASAQRLWSLGSWSTFIPIAVTVEYWVGLSNRTPYSI